MNFEEFTKMFKEWDKYEEWVKTDPPFSIKDIWNGNLGFGTLMDTSLFNHFYNKIGYLKLLSATPPDDYIKLIKINSMYWGKRGYKYGIPDNNWEDEDACLIWKN